MSESQELIDYIAELVQRTERREIAWRESGGGYVWRRPKENFVVIATLQRATSANRRVDYLLEVAKRPAGAVSTGKTMLSLSSAEKEYLGPGLARLFEVAASTADSHAAAVLRSLLD